MSLKLSKTSTIPYDYFSESTGLNPITTQVTLDNTGGIKPSDVISVFLIATQFNYTGIAVAPVSEQTGINWRVSLDNLVWSESVNPTAMDALLEDKNIPIFFGAVVNNNAIQVTVPKLNYLCEHLQSGTATLEVIVDGNLFTPWIDQIEFEEERKVVVESVVELDKKQDSKIQIGASLVNESITEMPKEKKTGFKQFVDDYI